MNILDTYCVTEIKRHGGNAVKSVGNVFQQGWTDIIGCLNGQAIFWETKLGMDELRPAQKIFMKKMSNAGGDVRLISVKAEVDTALQELAAGKRSKWPPL